MRLSRRATLRLTSPLLLAACRVTGESTSPRAPAIVSRRRERPVAEIEALVAFARMYGYLRFFHPSDACARADWQQVALYGVRAMREVVTLGALADRLGEMFEPLAPLAAIWVEPEPAPSLRRRTAAVDERVYWQHQGYRGSPVSLYASVYSATRVGDPERGRRRFAETPPPDLCIQTDLADGLRARVPVVLSAQEARASGVSAALADAKSGEAARAGASEDARDLALAAIVEVWNVLRHFYPHQEQLGIAWQQELVTALESVRAGVTLERTLDALWRLVHVLSDGHGDVGVKHGPERGLLPVRFELIEGKALVTATADERVRVGDVVLRIGDEDALDRIARFESKLSGSPQWRRFRAAAWEAPKIRHGEAIELTIERDGVRRVERVEAMLERAPAPPRPPVVHFYADGVAYVDLTRAAWADIEVGLELLAAAPGVVFDMRGYPDRMHKILDHLLAEPESRLWMQVPRIVEPDGKIAGWTRIGWNRTPEPPRITGAKAFLISAEAISYAESIVGYVEAHHLGTLVGSPTAGANGDIVWLDTVGGLYVVFTGMRVLRSDGSTLHGKGIAPDVTVERTIAGLRAGRDEVLERGLAVVRERVAGARPDM